VHVDPLAVAGIAVGSLLLPLGLGLAIGNRWPAEKRWISAMQRVSGNAVLLCIAAFVLIGWPRIVELVSAREGTIPALALIALIGLAIGHVLGGPNADDRTRAGIRQRLTSSRRRDRRRHPHRSNSGAHWSVAGGRHH
jgi:BASS family bile acid:Na+ symporter